MRQPLAAAASFNIFHSFTGPDGNEPTWLLKARDSTLWGVTFLGGTAGLGNGVLYKNDGFFYGTCKQDGLFGFGSGAGTFWKSDAVGNVTVLHIFGPKTLYGDEPTQQNGVLQAADGFFYGVANSGGLDSQGAIFRADATGNVATIHSFNDYATDGSDPKTNFVLARDGFF